MTAALGTVANWWTNQVVEFGLTSALALHTIAVTGLICGIRAALKARARRRATAQATQDGVRVAENYANHQAVREAVDADHQPRKENRP
jgi:hypothetical protein